MSAVGPEALAAALTSLEGPVVVCAHERPDGDAIGSILGTTLALERLGIRAEPRLGDPAPLNPAYRTLPGADRLRVADPSETFPAMVALDVTGLDRLGAAATHIDSASVIAHIDHHPDSAAFGTHTWVDPTAPAVGAMIWTLLPLLDVTADREIATCLYAALMTDTGRFGHDNTTSAALRIAAEMVDAGADPSDLSSKVYQSRSAGALALIGRVLARTELARNGAVAYSWVTTTDYLDLGVEAAEVEDLVDWVRMVEGPRVAFLVKLDDHAARVSLRSKDGTDVGAIARTLGGGGHAAAAGATVSGDLGDALSHVLPLLPDLDS